MRDITGRNAANAEAIASLAKKSGVDLRTVEIDVQSQDSVDKGVAKVIADTGRIDVLIHNAGHMVFGPAEAFMPEQYAYLYDVNVLSTQRVNRAVLPHIRRQKQGLLVWVSSSSSAGGTPPYLAPYFGAKAAMDAIAVQYARELSRWGIETSIIGPGAFTSGTDFAHSGNRPMKRLSANMTRGLMRGSASMCRKPSRPSCRLMLTPQLWRMRSCRWSTRPFGKRPFRVHIDPTEDGASVGFTVLDRVRAEMLHRVGLSDLLKPAARV